MNKTMVYTMTALLSLSALTGCGRMEGGENMRPTERPMTTASPLIATPDPEDGYVRDDDGIITDDDTGRGDTATARPTMNPGAASTPGTGTNPGASARPAGSAMPSGSPSPSPSADTGMK